MIPDAVPDAVFFSVADGVLDMLYDADSDVVSICLGRRVLSRSVASASRRNSLSLSTGSNISVTFGGVRASASKALRTSAWVVESCRGLLLQPQGVIHCRSRLVVISL